MSTPKPKQPDKVEQPPALTSDDETALDKAWDSITDADIAASIAWLAETEKDKPAKPAKPKQRRDPLDDL